MGQAAAEKSAHGNYMADGTHELIQLKRLAPSRWNPRGEIIETAPRFRNLVKSVKGSGVVIPVSVRPHPEDRKKWELLYGERRRRAAILAGLKEIPAIVRLGLSDEQAFEITFLENFGRDDLTPLEEASAVSMLLNKYHGDAKAVAAKLGWPVSRVARRAHLTKLSEAWRLELAAEGSWFRGWTAAHLELIARHEEEQQDMLLDKWSKPGEYTYLRDVPVADLEDELTREFRVLEKAPWKRKRKKGEPGLTSADYAGCEECMKRTGAKPSLFDMLPADKLPLTSETTEKWNADLHDRCMDPKCWKRKVKAWVRGEHKEAEKKQGRDVVRISTNYSAPKGVPNSDAWTAAKKSDADAVPALVVDGTGLGKVKYVKLRAPAQAETTKDTKSGETKQTLADIKRDRVDHIVERMAELLAGAAGKGKLKKYFAGSSKQACTVEGPDVGNMNMLVLVAAIGAEPVVSSGLLKAKDLADLATLPVEDLQRLVWCGVRDYILSVNMPDPEIWPRFCELAGIDYAALEAEAVKKFPDPEPAPKVRSRSGSGRGRSATTPGASRTRLSGTASKRP